MSEIVRKLEHFDFYDFKNIELHLEKMALKGLMLVNPGNLIWKYKKIQPKKLHFSVNYFPDALTTKRDPTDDFKIMEEFCEKDGWILVARFGQMQIFYNEKENPNPIETDVTVQVETIHKSMRKNQIPSLITSLVFSIWMMCMQTLTHSPVDILSSKFYLWLTIGWLLWGITSLSEIMYYSNWHRKAKRYAESGELLPIDKKSFFRKITAGLSAVFLVGAFLTEVPTLKLLLISLICVAIPITFNITVGHILKKKGFSRQKIFKITVPIAVILTLVSLGAMTHFILNGNIYDTNNVVGTYNLYGKERNIYNYDIPLEVNDIMKTENRKWSKEKTVEKTFLLSKEEYRQYTVDDEKTGINLEYTLTKVKNPRLNSFVKNTLLNEVKDDVRHGETVCIHHYEKIDASLWQADEAYQVYFSSGLINKYLLCYGNTFINITLESKPTKEQMQIIKEKLVN